jgi:hypothetical protein
LSCLLWLALGSSALAQAPVTYNVIYTGQLFGYFRYPELQVLRPSDQGGCSALSEEDQHLGPPEEAFQDLLNTRKASMRVAVGDNFAPFLLARQAWRPGADRLVPKEEYNYLPNYHMTGDWVRVNDDSMKKVSDDTQKIYHGEGTVPMDNVGCFLRLMHFDAIVPGKHDFYFGPERLRQLARFLKTDATSNPNNPRHLGFEGPLHPSF